jgi:leucine dehydrogenase
MSIESEPERVIEVARADLGLHAFVVIDSRRRGPAFGGIRRHAYPTPAAARRDACDLARAMTIKCALAQLPAGGGKTAIVDHPGLDRPRAYRALGEVIESLAGAYVCGPDLGTGPDELRHVRAATRFVNPAANDAGASTAAGVSAGLVGLLEALDGHGELARRRFAVQGLGAVGAACAARLCAAGATVFGHDPDPVAASAAARLGVVSTPPEDLWRVECDVWMPCALGGGLDGRRAAQLRARGVCGSANNQLADSGVARALADRSIAWAPDVCVNAGAVIEGVLTVTHGETPTVRAEVQAAIEAIRPRTRALVEQARAQRRTTLEVAFERALHMLRRY